MGSTADCQHLLHPFVKRRGSGLSVNRVMYALLVILLSNSNHLRQVNASTITCDPNYNGTISEQLRGSEIVLRGKIIQVRDSNSLTVRVLNVYRGDNSTQRQDITVNMSTNSHETGTPEKCMTNVSKGEKFILFLRRQSPSLSEEYKFDLLYDGLLATREISRTVRQLSERLVIELELAVDFVTTMAMGTQSDADHYAECDTLEANAYCQNGGTCVYIVKLLSNSCQCPEEWWGERCGLFRYNENPDEGVDPTPAIILGCMSAFILFICILVAIIYIRNRKRLPSGGEVEGSRDVESLHSHQEDLSADNNQNTKIQFQELIEKEKQTTNYSKIENDSEVTTKDQIEASSEEVTPLNSNCNRSTTSGGTLYYPKQSTV